MAAPFQFPLWAHLFMILIDTGALQDSGLGPSLFFVQSCWNILPVPWIPLQVINAQPSSSWALEAFPAVCCTGCAMVHSPSLSSSANLSSVWSLTIALLDLRSYPPDRFSDSNFGSILAIFHLRARNDLCITGCPSCQTPAQNSSVVCLCPEMQPDSCSLSLMVLHFLASLPHVPPRSGSLHSFHSQLVWTALNSISCFCTCLFV